MHCVRIIICTGDSSFDVLLLVLDDVFDFHLASAAKSRRDIFMSGANTIAGPLEQYPEAFNNSGRYPTNSDRPFDVLDWIPQYLSCQRYFIDHAQLSGPVQAIAAYVNIHLPFQRPPIPSRAPLDCPPPVPGRSHPTIFHTSSPVSLIPYLRRLVVTGMDSPGVLHGFFGDDWASGVGSIHKQERRNYLFSAKSEGWIATKRDYDMLPLETVPFMRPLQGSATTEIEGAENTWSEWLAMGDWMVGPRAPDLNLENTQEKGGRSEMLGGA